MLLKPPIYNEFGYFLSFESRLALFSLKQKDIQDLSLDVFFVLRPSAAGPRRFEVSPAGSVGAPHFVRVVHRTTAPRLAL